MATSTYSVKVVNASGDTQSYLFFNEVPQESGSIGTIYTNVWTKSPGVPSPNGKAEFTVKEADFAICGTTPIPVDYGVVCSTSDWAPVSLTAQTSQGTVADMSIVDGGPQFVKPFSTTTKANSFGINTEVFDPDQYDTVYVGLGKYNNKQEVVPVAVWRAKPQRKYVITPVVTYYVGTGKYEPGTVVDITTLGATVKIDFTTAKPGQTVATVTHNKNGTYSPPTFSYPGLQDANRSGTSSDSVTRTYTPPTVQA